MVKGSEKVNSKAYINHGRVGGPNKVSDSARRRMKCNPPLGLFGESGLETEDG